MLSLWSNRRASVARRTWVIHKQSKRKNLQRKDEGVQEVEVISEEFTARENEVGQRLSSPKGKRWRAFSRSRIGRPFSSVSGQGPFNQFTTDKSYSITVPRVWHTFAALFSLFWDTSFLARKQVPLSHLISVLSLKTSAVINKTYQLHWWQIWHQDHSGQ